MPKAHTPVSPTYLLNLPFPANQGIIGLVTDLYFLYFGYFPLVMLSVNIVEPIKRTVSITGPKKPVCKKLPVSDNAINQIDHQKPNSPK